MIRKSMTTASCSTGATARPAALARAVTAAALGGRWEKGRDA
jgi:hypothetical protein